MRSANTIKHRRHWYHLHQDTSGGEGDLEQGGGSHTSVDVPGQEWAFLCLARVRCCLQPERQEFHRMILLISVHSQ